ncbi:MAG: M1 family metallopeptidase [Bacteroidia bacterium]
MKKLSLLFILFSVVAGCSLIGLHLKIHNPSRAGKYPKKTHARLLLGNQESKYRTCYDVKWYRLSIHFPNDLLKNKNISGLITIKSVATSNFDTLQIDLAENMNLETIYVSGSGKKFPIIDSLHYCRNKGAVFVIMKQAIKKGESFILDVAYSGEPNEAKKAPWSGGFVRAEDDLKKPWWGVACENEGASLWWPCKDVMNDEPDSVDVFFTVPAGLKAISNGKLISEQNYPVENDHEPRGMTEFHWHISYPINIYNITFYIGNFKLLHDTYYSEVTHDTLQLNHYVLEQHYDKAKEHFKQVKKYLAFYEATFGPYPWYRDGYKLVESPYAGMEHQSAIAYGNGFQNDLQLQGDYIILHETAHEWWGNSVTANDLADCWLHEGFATYAEALYVEKTGGYIAYTSYLRNYRAYIVNRRPLVGEKGIRYFNYKDGDIYMKGAWVLHSLRHVVANDSLFFDILHSFYMENRMKEISSKQFEETVNRKTGKNLHWFFEQYLYNRFTPELEYCVKDKTLFYRWNPGYSGEDFNQMNVDAVAILPNEPGNFPFDGGTYNVGSFTPSTFIKSKAQQNNNEIRFDDQAALFKATENKSLAKEFEKQSKSN